MANFQRIRELCKARDISLKTLSKEIGITETGMQYILNKNTTSIDNLEKIAVYFNVPIGYFFDEAILEEKTPVKENNTNEKTDLYWGQKLLNEKIDRLEIQVKLMNDIIDLMKKNQ